MDTPQSRRPLSTRGGRRGNRGYPCSETAVSFSGNTSCDYLDHMRPPGVVLGFPSPEKATRAGGKWVPASKRWGGWHEAMVLVCAGGKAPTRRNL